MLFERDKGWIKELLGAVSGGIIDEALAEAKERRLRGSDVTPFLLARIHSLSGGVSEEANRQLLYSNVRLGAGVARALSTASGWRSTQSA